MFAVLRAQKEMMLDKRWQINSIIQAIERIEKMKDEPLNYDSLVKIIEVIQMDLKPEWVSRYLTPDERRTMRDLAKQSYSQDALRKLAEQEFTEESHLQYRDFMKELKSRGERVYQASLFNTSYGRIAYVKTIPHSGENGGLLS